MTRSLERGFLFVLALGILGLVQAKDGTLFSKINATQYLTVQVPGFMVNGVFKPLGPPCQSPDLNNPCIHVVEQGFGNGVVISYKPSTNSSVLSPERLANLTAAGATVELRGCFSNVSNFDRAWRKPKDLIRKDNQCKTLIQKGLPLSGGNYTWELDGNVPTAVMFVRGYVRVPSPQYGPNTTTPVGYGQSLRSSGFFQVQKVNDRPPAMIAAACVCASVGPLILLAYFSYDQFVKKHK